MSEETKKSYGTWEEAVEALKRDFDGLEDMQTRLKESFSNFMGIATERMMKELEPAISVNIDQAIAEKVANASTTKSMKKYCLEYGMQFSELKNKI